MRSLFVLSLLAILLCFSPISAQDDSEFVNLDQPAPPAPAVVPQTEPATTTEPQITTTQENNIPVTQPADTTTTTTTTATENTPGEQANNNNDAPAPSTDVPATQAAPVTTDPATTTTPTPVKRKCKPSTTSATKETVEQGTAHANLAGFLPLNSLIFGGNQFTQQLSNTQFNNGLVQGSIFNTPASQTNGVLFSPVQSPTLNLGNNVLGNQVFGGGRLNVFQGNLAPQFQGPAAPVGLPGTGFLTFSAVNCDLNPDDPSCCIPDTESTPTIVGATDDNTVASGTAKVNTDDEETFFPVFRANPFVTVPTVGFNPGVNVLQNNGQTAGNFFTNNFNAVNQLSTTVTGLIQNNQLFNTFNNGFTNLLNGANNVNGNNNANVVTNLNNIANANFGAQMNANVLPDVANSFNQAFNGALATPVPTLVNVGAGFQITGFQTVKVFSTEDCAIPGSCDALKQSAQASNTVKGPTPITPVLSFNDDISIISLIVCLSILSGLFSGASALLVYRESKHVNSCPVQRRSLSQKV